MKDMAEKPWDLTPAHSKWCVCDDCVAARSLPRVCSGCNHWHKDKHGNELTGHRDAPFGTDAKACGTADQYIEGGDYMESPLLFPPDFGCNSWTPLAPVEGVRPSA